MWSGRGVVKVWLGQGLAWSKCRVAWSRFAVVSCGIVGSKFGGGHGVVGFKVWWRSRCGGGHGVVGLKVWWGSRCVVV